MASRAMVCLLLLLSSSALLRAETPAGLSQVKRLYVAPFPTERGSSELRDSLVKQLRKNRKFQLVSAPEQADAILKGAGELWIKGYIATNPRVPRQTRQPLYGGFLSVEIEDKNKDVLWSYLVTPTGFSWSSVSDDLSSNLVKHLVAAQGRNSQPVLASVGTTSPERTSLHGAGATFPAPLYQKWFESFEQDHPNVHITYDAVGSEAGLQLLSEGKIDFAGSDVPPDAGASQTANGVIRIASVLGGVVPIYNLKDVGQNLRFTPEVLAGIYLGRITRWNDPAIKASNRGARLPDVEIAVVHRSDGSGTTFTWSDYLSKTSADWKNTVGRGTTLEWPVGTGAEHNDGVAAMVQRTPNSIGYVELVYAIQHELSFGSVRNRSGEFVEATLETLAEAAKAGVASNSEFPASITNSSARGAYPIATFTWLLLPKGVSDPAKKTAMRDLLRWVLTEGQRQCSALAYSPLPREVVERELQLVDNLP